MSQPPLPHIDAPKRKPRAIVRPTFFIVLVLSVLITLFQTPIYQATAVVGLPASGDPAATAKSLEAPDVIKEVAANITSSDGQAPSIVSARAVASGPAMPGRFALIVESDDPDYAAVLTDAWAKTVMADSSGQAKMLVPAQKPSRPIRPKRAQNILVGAFLGLALGFALKLLRGARQASLR